MREPRAGSPSAHRLPEWVLDQCDGRLRSGRGVARLRSGAGLPRLAPPEATAMRRLRVSTSPRPRALSGVGASLLLGAVLSACVAPLADTGAFEHNARQALNSGVSQARTGALALENLLDHRLPRTYANTVVTDSEKAMGPVQDSFG